MYLIRQQQVQHDNLVATIPKHPLLQKSMTRKTAVAMPRMAIAMTVPETAGTIPAKVFRMLFILPLL